MLDGFANLLAVWSQDALQTEPLCVDRTPASEEEKVVQKATEGAADERAHHGNLNIR